MIGYVTLGTNDFERAAAYYDALLGELGAKRLLSDERMIFWGTAPDQPLLSVCKPYDEKAASVGNGTMVALNAGSKEMVAKLHAKALELGGTDEGAPGQRGGSAFHGGYWRDLDGNKLVAFYMDVG
jgi:catechol 2,3-dioxygenase-like lactoylglutathione lyase family enzyme